MKGEVLIEVCDKDDNVKYTVRKKNKITDFYKKYPFIVQHLNVSLYAAIPDESWTFPLVNPDGSFSFSESTESWNSYSGLSNTTYNRAVLESNYWDDDGKRILEFATSNYFEGEVEIKGLIFFVFFVSDASVYGPSLGYNYNRIFSALNVNPYITIDANERVYIHYKFIMEW
jgi:hypothetical protein